MTMPWEKTYDNGIPWFLRRDANNRAPFMDKPVNPSGSLPMRDLSEPLPWLATSSPRTA